MNVMLLIIITNVNYWERNCFSSRREHRTVVSTKMENIFLLSQWSYSLITGREKLIPSKSLLRFKWYCWWLRITENNWGVICCYPGSTTEYLSRRQNLRWLQTFEDRNQYPPYSPFYNNINFFEGVQSTLHKRRVFVIPFDRLWFTVIEKQNCIKKWIVMLH